MRDRGRGRPERGPAPYLLAAAFAAGWVAKALGDLAIRALGGIPAP